MKIINNEILEQIEDLYECIRKKSIRVEDIPIRGNKILLQLRHSR